MHLDIHPNVAGSLFSLLLSAFPDMTVAPQQDRIRHREGDQVPAVDGDARALFGPVDFGLLFTPAPDTQFPEGECLQGGGFACVVRTHQHHGFTEIDRNLFEQLEIADDEPVEHGSFSGRSNLVAVLLLAGQAPRLRNSTMIAPGGSTSTWSGWFCRIVVLFFQKDTCMLDGLRAYIDIRDQVTLENKVPDEIVS